MFIGPKNRKFNTLKPLNTENIRMFVVQIALSLGNIFKYCDLEKRPCSKKKRPRKGVKLKLDMVTDLYEILLMYRKLFDSLAFIYFKSI